MIVYSLWERESYQAVYHLLLTSLAQLGKYPTIFSNLCSSTLGATMLVLPVMLRKRLRLSLRLVMDAPFLHNFPDISGAYDMIQESSLFAVTSFTLLN